LAVAVTTRVFHNVRLWRLDAAGFEAAADLIADAEANYLPEVVVGIERGGRPIADAAAKRLGVPTASMTARHNDTDAVRVPATGRVRVDDRGVGLLPVQARVLLVDDICGSGATMQTVAAVIRGVLRPRLLRTAVLCRNAGATYTPDTWVWDVADWTCFPWEDDPGQPTETLEVPREVRHP
jgi:hypoxanthine phosphoribosyltransferase